MLLYAFAIRLVWSTLAGDAARAGVGDEARWIDFQFTSDTRDGGIFVQQQRGDLFVYDFPVVVLLVLLSGRILAADERR